MSLHSGNMKLLELFKAVEERNLTKDQLEEYRDDLSRVCGQMIMELADIKKVKAFYFIEKKDPTDSDKATERKWQVTREGQREIELTGYIKATEKLLSSLKGRLYQLY